MINEPNGQPITKAESVTTEDSYNIYYVSMGAPSVTMLINSLAPQKSASLESFFDNIPNEVVYVNLGFDYPEVTETARVIAAICRENQIKFTELNGDLEELMLRKKISGKSRPANWKVNLMWRAYTIRLQRGYGWCGGRIRFGTTLKNKLINEHLRELRSRIGKDKLIRCYIGLTSGEEIRANRQIAINTKKNCIKLYPLIDGGYSKDYCKQLVKEKGLPISHIYEAGLNYVGCWCCRNHGIKELRSMRNNMPEIYNKLKELEKAIKEPYYRSPRGWALLDDVRWNATQYQQVDEQDEQAEQADDNYGCNNILGNDKDDK